ncbi:MAG: hypothetical protein ABIQ35_03970 [Verrucomicrobiota bacterium]
MKTQLTLRFHALVAGLMVFIGSAAAHASFHFMQIEQVIGGVDGDTSAQAIQLRMRSAGQNLVSSASLWVSDAAGVNRILLLKIAANVGNSAAGDRVLLVSPGFTNYLGSGFSPDFTLANIIPTNYFKAGRLTFEADGGTTTTPGTIYWSVSWGGTNYTGSQTGSTFNDANGNFGPAFNGPLPSTDTSVLQFTNSAAALSTSNSVDYTVTSGPAIFVKNSRSSFVVVDPRRINSINRETNDLRVTFTMIPGKTNSLQRSVSTTDGSISTNFTNIFTVNNPTGSLTNYLDIGAVTNFKAGYYRTRLVP